MVKLECVNNKNEIIENNINLQHNIFLTYDNEFNLSLTSQLTQQEHTRAGMSTDTNLIGNISIRRPEYHQEA